MRTNKPFIFYGALVLLVFLNTAELLSIEAFHAQWFWDRPKENLYQVEVGLNSSTGSEALKGGMKIFSLGDINNDKWTDMITVSDDQTQFTLHYFNMDEYRFIKSNQTISVPNNYIITQIHTSVDKSSSPTIYVTVQSDSSKTTQVKNYQQIGENLQYADSGQVIFIAYNSQPMFIDIDGDLKNEILYNSASDSKQLMVFSISSNTTVEFNSNFVVQDDENCMKPTNNSILSTPDSSAFLDLDGDCMPDLFLTKEHNGVKGYEVYIQQMKDDKQMYCLVQKDTFQSQSTAKIPLINFADIDRDGMNDMIFYQGGSLFVFYNRYQANPVTELNLCRTSYPTSHFTSNPLFSSFNSISTDTKSIDTQVIDKTGSMTLASPASHIPGRLRIADLDADGFPDVLMTLNYTTSSSKYETKTFILMNQPYEKTDQSSQLILAQGFTRMMSLVQIGNETAVKGRRKFEEPTNQYMIGSFADVNTNLCIFIDIDEDGRLDFLVQSVSKTTGLTEIHCIYNNYVKDTFFVKALMLNTLNVYTDASSGTSYRLIATDLNDNKFVIMGSQLPQSSYLALMTQASYIGIGRSNNYIETFTAAISIKAQRSIRTWTPLIPNSQLFLFAPEPNTSKWFLELFVNPTGSLAMIVVACSVCLLLIGIVIIILHIGEKRADKLSQKNFYF